jgi:hypothetical protein
VIKKFTPAAPKIWLYFVAGVMWSGVGLFLGSLTVKWLEPETIGFQVAMVSGGSILAILIYQFGFSRFANNNIRRILNYANDKVCIFAFQQWTSYPLVIFMISLGIFLRKYSPIPKPWLAGMYIGIGGSLFLASFHYYAAIWRATGAHRKNSIVKGER